MNFESINTEIDLDYLYQDGMTFSELEEEVHQWINEVEVIYYSVAMQLLSNNDPSLNRSLELASELGFETSSLNSELLATLLKQGMLREEWYEISDEVEELFEEDMSGTIFNLQKS